ncbi:MAG: dTDP-4-dehydrorhamnose 3,5-epimerase [Treponema sp.]|nr:dTDP-4-dehydrorhamnose 3,5-epimerase [Treponema sp.]
MFEFKKCMTDDGKDFPGLYEIQCKKSGDVRGAFFEVYSERIFFDAGLKVKFVQDNQSISVKGVLRRLHFQTIHPQGKLVRAAAGCISDVALDLRNGSPTFGKYHGIVLDGEKQNQLYIPEGFAHGFYVLSDTAIFSCKCTDFYDKEGEGGIIWNDSTLSIDWNCRTGKKNLLISKKDTALPGFDIEKKYFDTSGKWIGGTSL